MTTNNWRLVVSGALTLGFIAICVMAYIIIVSIQTRSLPFRYANTTPAGAYSRELCPNEPLQFDIQVIITSAPSVVMVVENWQRASGGKTVGELSPAYYIHEAPKVAGGRVSIPLPELDPGNWVYERAAIVSTANTPTLIQIPFTVLDCGGE